jgi:hypothetical protein
MQLTLLEAEMLSVIQTVLREVAGREPPQSPDSYLPWQMVAALQRVADKATAQPNRMEQTT